MGYAPVRHTGDNSDNSNDNGNRVSEHSIRKFENHFGRLGGVVVGVLATGPKGCGFKTRPRQWIFKGDKNTQHTFLSDGK
jgi:hypothetical protein